MQNHFQTDQTVNEAETKKTQCAQKYDKQSQSPQSQSSGRVIVSSLWWEGYVKKVSQVVVTITTN